MKKHHPPDDLHSSAAPDPNVIPIYPVDVDKEKRDPVFHLPPHPLNLLTGPIIYSMVFPLMLLDLFVSFYQMTCFPVYKIEKVKRNEFIIFDRQELKFLDWFEKFHCTYCAYGTGVLAYVSEIVSRTEQYFCPIKHAQRHKKEALKKIQYLEFEEIANYHEKLERIRKKLQP